MKTEQKVLDGLHDLIAELESIMEGVEDEGLLDEHLEELQGQSGTITTILESWNE